jgi:hypothetical protein
MLSKFCTYSLPNVCFVVFLINVREHERGNKKMNNPEKLAVLGTHDTS